MLGPAFLGANKPSFKRCNSSTSRSSGPSCSVARTCCVCEGCRFACQSKRGAPLLVDFALIKHHSRRPQSEESVWRPSPRPLCLHSLRPAGAPAPRSLCLPPLLPTPFEQDAELRCVPCRTCPRRSRVAVQVVAKASRSRVYGAAEAVPVPNSPYELKAYAQNHSKGARGKWWLPRRQQW